MPRTQAHGLINVHVCGGERKEYGLAKCAKDLQKNY